MEKQALLGRAPASATPQPQRPMRNGKVALVMILILCIAAPIFRPSWHTTRIWTPVADPRVSVSSPAPEFDWGTAPIRPHLEYASCFEHFQCARLELPMDYWNGSTDAKISLAIIKRPAKVNVTHPQYGGAVLINPGGPGGSGVDLVLGSGPKIGDMIDTRSKDDVLHGKYFDIISFDPRGVGDSRPSIQCGADPQMSQSWALRVMEEGVLGSSDAGLGRLWSMAVARSQSCSLPPKDGRPDIKRFSSTASVARDMVSIVEAHGEWREKEAEKLLGIVPGNPRKRIQVPTRIKWKRGGEKLQYWGFSYGTYLGMTFAAMFPDKVERLVVDGVVDPYDYRKSLWYDNLVDTEKDMDEFYSNCARVGFPICRLANETGPSTSEGVKQRAENITKSLYHNPLPVIGDNPEVITYSDIKNLVFAGLYKPVESFPLMANLLADVEQGNGTIFAQLLKDYHKPSCPASQPQQTPPFTTPSLIQPLWNLSGPGKTQLSMDALTIIACTDGDSQANLTRAGFEKHLQREITLSPSIGAMWATIRLECAHLSLRALHRFTAPFVGATAHPLLFVGNTADPVTPLRNAVKMARAYPGAVALTQDSPGHCSISSASSCTARYVREYFQTGELPPEGHVCEVDEWPFGPTPGEEKLFGEAYDAEEVEAVRRMRGAASAVAGLGWI